MDEMNQIWMPHALFQVRKETIENTITMATSFSLKLFHTIHGITKQSNLEQISEGHLIPLFKVRPTSGQVWSTSNDGDSAASLGSLFQYQIAQRVGENKQKKPLLFYASIPISAASSTEAGSSWVVHPLLFSTLSSTRGVSAPPFFPCTLHNFHPTQPQTQSQCVAGKGIGPVFVCRG